MIKYVVEGELRSKGWRGGDGREGQSKSKAGEGPIHQPRLGSFLHSWLTRGGDGRGPPVR